ncbi:terpene synthase family protein [Streptomyces celluloflavus]|uniref:terpene synthase family protein n=1 Tax=Streptomyces celluloflavus TaxID=58344 RepID=UPI0036AFFC35
MRQLNDLMSRWQQQTHGVEQQMPWLRSRLDAMSAVRETMPDHDPFDDEVRDWALHSGVYGTGNAQELEDLQLGRVTRLCVPDRPAGARWLIAKYFAWTTATDDGMTDHGADLTQIASTASRVLRNGAAPQDGSPTALVMSGIRDGLLRLDSADFLPTLADLVAADLRAWQEEQGYLSQETLPGPSDYLSLRTKEFDTLPMMAMHQWLLEPGGPDGLPGGRHAGLLSEITELASLVAGLDNDLTGLLKDLARPEPMNVVFVLALHHGVPLTTAVHMAVAVHEALRHRLDRLLTRVRTLPGTSPGLLQQAQAAVGWADALHTWFTSAPRYQLCSEPTHVARAL